ncbi:MAG TPA: type I methionyl aminopeptidase [Tetrasphaera sp.]|uniref:type I methionyl aminopeptidase n=1 Tax=Nostocoides sp. TaxID=1917966 RepID=UPI002C7CB38A|nr:type I methionyl aminopeptidase [Tetrasphaera sp.]HNQ05758.1 type I methionyl aminopeptidase [Tetrasphaera sp.]
MFGRERLETKSLDQVRAMRPAGLLVGQCLEMLGASVRGGMTTGDLDALAEGFIRDHGGRPSFAEVPGYRHTLCTSVNEEIVHGIPGERVLCDGDLLSVDCGAIVDGWHGDAAISLIVGGRAAGAPADLALMDATEASLWAGIAALKVGRDLFAVGAAVERSILETGKRDGRAYGIVEDYVGHGIGREMHMSPNVPNYAVAGRGPTIKSACTVAIEPMVTLGDQANEVLADQWTVVTLDRSRASHWEHTVACHAGGIWVLTAIDGGAGRLGTAYAPLS